MINKLHSFTFSLQTMPYDAIQNLHDKLIPFSKPFSLSQNRTFNFGSKKEEAGIVLMTQGVYSICHVEKNSHIATGFAPSIVGLVDNYSLYYDVPFRPAHHIFAETDCMGYFLPLELFVGKTDEFCLWHDIAKILAHRLLVMSAKDQELVGTDAYLTIHSLLIELWTYPEDYRCQVNVQDFINRRSGVSRSQIMKILAELKKGEYIEIVSGKLVKLKRLPSKF
ncbi:UNVERIFIED_ORG: hypothetical protein J2Y78_004882 [Buttiauxella agrestis ATCC 33320]